MSTRIRIPSGVDFNEDEMAVVEYDNGHIAVIRDDSVSLYPSDFCWRHGIKGISSNAHHAGEWSKPEQTSNCDTPIHEHIPLKHVQPDEPVSQHVLDVIAEATRHCYYPVEYEMETNFSISLQFKQALSSKDARAYADHWIAVYNRKVKS